MGDGVAGSRLSTGCHNAAPQRQADNCHQTKLLSSERLGRGSEDVTASVQASLTQVASAEP